MSSPGSRKSSSPVSQLKALANIINASIETIETILVSRSQEFPDPDEPFDPASEAVRMSPDVTEQVSNIVAAAFQLAASVRVPALNLAYASDAFYISACLRVAIQCHVAESIREAGFKGVHAAELAKPTGADPHKLARCLRLLATHHYFREVAPDVFAHNKTSSLLDTGKPVSEIVKDPTSKHDGTPGFAALLEHCTDEGMKAGAWLPETLISPESALSGAVNKTAFNRGYQTDLPMWAWYEKPENAYQLKRFAVGMQGMQNMGPVGAILEGFDWKALPADSVVVDVGGGIGSQTMALSKTFDHLKFVVQDREQVIKTAEQHWREKAPKAIESGRVKLTVHDFFKPQPVQQPAVFLMRMILHDWSDEYALPILKALRTAAGPHTKLVLVDNTILYACRDTTATARGIPGVDVPEPMAPLLANKGNANFILYGTDLHMMALINGCERTPAEFDSLLKRSGWRLERVFHSAGFDIENAKLVAVPDEVSLVDSGTV